MVLDVTADALNVSNITMTGNNATGKGGAEKTGGARGRNSSLLNHRMEIQNFALMSFEEKWNHAS